MRTWHTHDSRPVQLTENMENALVQALQEGTCTIHGRSATALKNRGLAQDVAGWPVLTKGGRYVAEQIEIGRRQAKGAALEGEPEPAPKTPEYRPTPEITAQDRADTDRHQQDKAWRGRHGVIVPEQVAGAIDADHAEALAMNEPQIKGEVTTAAELKESADRVDWLARGLRAAFHESDTFDFAHPDFQERWRNVARAAFAEIEGSTVSPNGLQVGDLVRVQKSPATYQVSEIEGDTVRVRVAFTRHDAGWYASWMVRRA